MWKSIKACCVARSTLAAETLAFTKGADTACFINPLGEELLIPPTSQITTYTNNKSLHDSANIVSQISGYRLSLRNACYQRDKRRRGNRLIMDKQRKADCRLSYQEGSIMN